MNGRFLKALLVVTSFCACGSDSVMMPDHERGLHEVGNLTRPRNLHVATRLQNGKILIAGGNAALPPAGGGIVEQDLLVSAEIFDPETGISTPTGDLTVSRHRDHGILLPDGRVLMISSFSPGHPIENVLSSFRRIRRRCRRALYIRDQICHPVAQRKGPFNRRVTRWWTMARLRSR